MLVFAFTLLPLLLVCIFFYTDKNRRFSVLWTAVLGFFAAIIMILFSAVLTNNGFNPDWTSIVQLSFYYGITDFMLPMALAALCWCFFVKIGQLNNKDSLSAFVFLATAYLLFIMQRIAWYHVYFGFYELVFLPFFAFSLAAAAALLFSWLKFSTAFTTVLIICIAPTFVAAFVMGNRPVFAAVTAGVLLVILWLIVLISRGSLKYKKH